MCFEHFWGNIMKIYSLRIYVHQIVLDVILNIFEDNLMKYIFWEYKHIG